MSHGSGDALTLAALRVHQREPPLLVHAIARRLRQGTDLLIMHAFFGDFLAHQARLGFTDVHGAEARVRLPLREPLLNEWIARLVVPRQPALRHLELRIGDDNMLFVQARLSGLPLPRLVITLRLDRELSLTLAVG